MRFGAVGYAVSEIASSVVGERELGDAVSRRLSGEFINRSHPRGS